MRGRKSTAPELSVVLWLSSVVPEFELGVYLARCKFYPVNSLWLIVESSRLERHCGAILKLGPSRTRSADTSGKEML